MEAPSQEAVKAWFSSLPLAERQRAASVRHDTALVSTLVSAYTQLRASHSGPFCLCPFGTTPQAQKVMFDWDPTTATFRTASFPFVRSADLRAYPFSVGDSSATARAESMLLAAARIGWSLGPTMYAKPDTVFLHSAFVERPEVFFSVMDTVAHGPFLAHPITVDYISAADASSAALSVTGASGSFATAATDHPKHRSSASTPGAPTGFWRWSEPQWWGCHGFHTFCQFLALHIEVALWLQYYQECKADPRAPGCARRFMFPPSVASHVVFPQVDIAKSWGATTRGKKLLALSRVPELLDIADGKGTKTQKRRKQQQEPSDPKKQYTVVRNFLDALCEITDCADRTSLDVCLCMECVEDVARFSSDSMADTLFASTFWSYGTSRDMITKAYAVCMLDAHHDRMAEELIAESPKKSTKPKRRSSAPLPPLAIQQQQQQQQQKHGGRPVAAATAPGTPRSKSLAETPKKSPPRLPSQQLSSKQTQGQQQQQEQQQQQNTKTNTRKKRKAGPAAVALDLAAELEHPPAATRASRLCSQTKSSDGLDLATSAAHQKKYCQKQQPPVLPDSTVTGGSGSGATAKKVGKTSTEALDLAREKKRDPQKQQQQKQQQQSQRNAKSLTRSHSNPRKPIKTSGGLWLSLDSNIDNEAPFMTQKQLLHATAHGHSKSFSACSSPNQGVKPRQSKVRASSSYREQLSEDSDVRRLAKDDNEVGKEKGSASSVAQRRKGHHRSASSDCSGGTLKGAGSEYVMSKTQSSGDFEVDKKAGESTQKPASDSVVKHADTQAAATDSKSTTATATQTAARKNQPPVVVSQKQQQTQQFSDDKNAQTQADFDENLSHTQEQMNQEQEIMADKTAGQQDELMLTQQHESELGVPVASSSPSPSPRASSPQPPPRASDFFNIPPRERADVDGASQSWSTRITGNGACLGICGGWAATAGATQDDCISGSASPLSPAASPLAHSPVFGILSPSNSPCIKRIRNSRSLRLTQDAVDDMQNLFPGMKQPQQEYEMAMSPLDLALHPWEHRKQQDSFAGVRHPATPSAVGNFGAGAEGAMVTAPEILFSCGPVWMVRPYTAGTLEERLCREVLDFELYVTQDFDDRRHMFTTMLRRVTEVTQRVLPGAKVEVYGSYATSLCIPTSDLDVVCCLRDAKLPLRPSFRKLAVELRKEEWMKDIKPIETATVPIIKIISHTEDLPTDISFDAEDTVGVPLHKGLRSVDVTRKFLAETPKLRPLVLLVKQFLSDKDLNNTYTGGLGGYCLVIMAKVFLHVYHTNPDNFLPPENGPANAKPVSTEKSLRDLGRAVLEFFRYFGTVFDYATMGISTKRGGTFYRIGETGYYSKAAPLVIEDPIDSMTNIGAGVFAMWQVRSAFEEAYNALTFEPDTPCTSLLERIIWSDSDDM